MWPCSYLWKAGDISGFEAPGVRGELFELAGLGEKGFDGVGGERELRLPTGTRAIDFGFDVIPRSPVFRSINSNSNVLSGEVYLGPMVEPCESCLW